MASSGTSQVIGEAHRHLPLCRKPEFCELAQLMHKFGLRAKDIIDLLKTARRWVESGCRIPAKPSDVYNMEGGFVCEHGWTWFTGEPSDDLLENDVLDCHDILENALADAEVGVVSNANVSGNAVVSDAIVNAEGGVVSNNAEGGVVDANVSDAVSDANDANVSDANGNDEGGVVSNNAEGGVVDANVSDFPLLESTWSSLRKSGVVSENEANGLTKAFCDVLAMASVNLTPNGVANNDAIADADAAKANAPANNGSANAININGVVFVKNNNPEARLVKNNNAIADADVEPLIGPNCISESVATKAIAIADAVTDGNADAAANVKLAADALISLSRKGYCHCDSCEGACDICHSVLCEGGCDISDNTWRGLGEPVSYYQNVGVEADDGDVGDDVVDNVDGDGDGDGDAHVDGDGDAHVDVVGNGDGGPHVDGDGDGDGAVDGDGVGDGDGDNEGDVVEDGELVEDGDGSDTEGELSLLKDTGEENDDKEDNDADEQRADTVLMVNGGGSEMFSPRTSPFEPLSTPKIRPTTPPRWKYTNSEIEWHCLSVKMILNILEEHCLLNAQIDKLKAEVDAFMMKQARSAHVNPSMAELSKDYFSIQDQKRDAMKLWDMMNRLVEAFRDAIMPCHVTIASEEAIASYENENGEIIQATASYEDEDGEIVQASKRQKLAHISTLLHNAAKGSPAPGGQRLAQISHLIQNAAKGAPAPGVKKELDYDEVDEA